MNYKPGTDETLIRRRTFLTASSTTLIPLVAGCIDGIGGGQTTTEYDREPQNEIRITEEKFDPIEAWVPPGMEVTWTNESGSIHTIAAKRFHEDTKQWGLQYTLGEGDEMTHTFQEDGIYEYECNIHGQSNECGVVVVGNASFDRTLPCE
jgi:plastocyanin